MESRISVLARPTYGLTEAARLLKVVPSTLRWWLEGTTSHGKVYPPVLRPEPTGSSDVTWGEFVEAGYLREYRQSLPLQRLRPLIAALRDELGTPFPLATAKPLVGGRQLVWNLQAKFDLPEELWIVVGGTQLVLGDAASAFYQRVEFDPVTAEAERFTVMKGPRPVVVNPRVSFGIPTVRGVRTEVIAELVVAGEPPATVAEIYEDYGIDAEDIDTALTFEREFMKLAA